MNNHKTTKKSNPNKSWYFFDLNTRTHFLLTDEMIFGRESGHLNFPNDPEVSQIHCKISIDNNHIFITDLSSTNGTIVNDVVIPTRLPFALKINDKIKFGNQEFIFINNPQSFDKFSEESNLNQRGFADKTVVVNSKNKNR